MVRTGLLVVKLPQLTVGFQVETPDTGQTEAYLISEARVNKMIMN